MIRTDTPPGTLGRLSDDQLGTVAATLAVADLHWTPDVAPAVLDRISRDAVAYPEHFDRRRRRPDADTALPAVEAPSVGRTLLRLVVVAVIVLLVAALVVAPATVSAGDLLASAGETIAR